MRFPDPDHIGGRREVERYKILLKYLLKSCHGGKRSIYYTSVFRALRKLRRKEIKESHLQILRTTELLSVQEH